MDVTEIRVEFRKTVSDGSYGNETYSVVFTATPDTPEDALGDAFRLAADAHDTVLSRLRGSTNEYVRQALETAEEREARHERERAEREAEWQRRRAVQAKRDTERDAAAQEAYSEAYLEADDEPETDDEDDEVEGDPL